MMTLSDKTVTGRKEGAPVNEVRWTQSPEGTVRQLWRAEGTCRRCARSDRDGDGTPNVVDRAPGNPNRR